MKNCIEIGTIQQFLDRELSNERAENVMAHCSECDLCAMLLAELETGNVEVFGAIDSEVNLLVPTERLRKKVFASIEEIERKKVSSFERGFKNLFGFFGVANAGSPTLAMAGMVLLFAGMVLGILQMSLFENGGQGELALIERETDLNSLQRDSNGNLSFPGILVNENEKQNTTESETDSTEEVGQGEIVMATGDRLIDTPRIARELDRRFGEGNREKIRAQNAAYRPQPRRIQPRRANRSANGSEGDRAKNQFVRTIDKLDSRIAQDRDYLLTPKERISYEKNLAIINDSIKRMKKEVKKNPKNSVAKELLTNSYQNKIDLINSINEQADLVAGNR